MGGAWHEVWHGLAVAEEAAVAGTGAANAAFFARRAVMLHGPRRVAAGVLALLFGGLALEAAGDLAGGAPAGAAVVLGQAPLVLAMVAAGWLVVGGRR